EYANCIGFPSTLSPGEVRRQPAQSRGPRSEIPEAIMVGLAPMIPAVNLLDDHRELEHAEHFVIADMRDIAPRGLCVSFHQFIPRKPTGPRGQRRNAGHADFGT